MSRPVFIRPGAFCGLEKNLPELLEVLDDPDYDVQVVPAETVKTEAPKRRRRS